jgi:hypothetical protein
MVRRELSRAAQSVQVHRRTSPEYASSPFDENVSATSVESRARLSSIDGMAEEVSGSIGSTTPMGAAVLPRGNMRALDDRFAPRRSAVEDSNPFARQGRFPYCAAGSLAGRAQATSAQLGAEHRRAPWRAVPPLGLSSTNNEGER